MKRAMIFLALAVLLGVFFLWPARKTPAASGPMPGTVIWVELDRKRLTVYENGMEAAAFPIASGARDTPSPVGVFQVNRKFATALSGFGTRFLGLNVPWGNFGIHGTNAPSSIGQNASHGCIRLRVKDAEKLYAMVPYGSKVVIEGGAYGPLTNGLRLLQEGDRGSDVVLLQRKLIQKGYLSGSADGVFGFSTRRAVISARKDMGFSPSDQADAAFQRALGMVLFE